MNKLFGAALALTLLGTGAAVAQPYNYDRNDRGVYDNRGYDRDGRDWNDRDRRDWNDRDRFDRRDNNWRRGMTFRDHNRFTIRDWNRHGLHRPGRGLHWVHYGNVFLLVNNRGLVVDVVFRPRFGGGYRY